MDVTRLANGSAVNGPEGWIGTYVGTRAPTAADNHAYVLVRLARLFGLLRSTRLVPMGWVRRSAPGADRVTLDATRAQVAGCPALRSDTAIQEDVSKALSGASGFFRVPTIRSSVTKGVVRLRGHSEHRAATRRALAHVWEVPGVLAVQDDSYEDGALIIAVAQALTHDPDTRTATLLVSSRLGAVGLNGTVPSEQARQRASALARAVPGVTEVRNHAQVLAPQVTPQTAPGRAV